MQAPRKEKAAVRAARVREILARLDEQYGTEYICYLNHETPWQLLIAVILSAQCTDARVNLVTETLFQKYDSVEKFAEADLKELEQDIHSTGFYHNKAKNIIACCKTLMEQYGGEVPSGLSELTSLAGVGRKTANLLLGDLYGKPAVVCDTHCIRIANRLGLARGKEPEKVERQLRAILPPEESSDFCHRIVLFGREVCTARSPHCDRCELRPYCREFSGE